MEVEDGELVDMEETEDADEVMEEGRWLWRRVGSWWSRRAMRRSVGTELAEAARRTPTLPFEPFCIPEGLCHGRSPKGCCLAAEAIVVSLLGGSVSRTVARASHRRGRGGGAAHCRSGRPEVFGRQRRGERGLPWLPRP